MRSCSRLIELAGASEVPLVREASVAALGAIGDERGLAAIIAGCSDLPAVRRRAVLALAPFEGDEVEAAIERALVDRDWQVRQAAEDLRRAERRLRAARVVLWQSGASQQPRSAKERGGIRRRQKSKR